MESRASWRGIAAKEEYEMLVRCLRQRLVSWCVDNYVNGVMICYDLSVDNTILIVEDGECSYANVLIISVRVQYLTSTLTIKAALRSTSGNRQTRYNSPTRTKTTPRIQICFIVSNVRPLLPFNRSRPCIRILRA